MTDWLVWCCIIDLLPGESCQYLPPSLHVRTYNQSPHLNHFTLAVSNNNSNWPPLYHSAWPPYPFTIPSDSVLRFPLSICASLLVDVHDLLSWLQVTSSVSVTKHYYLSRQLDIWTPLCPYDGQGEPPTRYQLDLRGALWSSGMEQKTWCQMRRWLQKPFQHHLK